MEYQKDTPLKHYREKRSGKDKKISVTVPESALQQQMDDMLNAYRIKYIRIQDSQWKWLKRIEMMLDNSKTTNEQIGSTIRKTFKGFDFTFKKSFAGLADNILIEPISDNYNLCLCAELKTTTGKLHGKQKLFEKKVAVQVLRSTQQNIDAINAYKKQIEKCKKCMIDERG